MESESRIDQENSFHLRIFLSSPGDVAEERRLAERILYELQRKPFVSGKVVITVVSWDDPYAPSPVDAGEAPQISVNRYKGRPADCDLTVVILWGRLGSPPHGMVRPDGTPYESGTIWEYEDALQHQKEVWVYRRDEKPNADLDDPEFEAKRKQYQSVNRFFDKFRNPDGSLKGGFNTYKQPEHFSDLFGKQLETFISHLFDKAPSRAGSIEALIELVKKSPEVRQSVAASKAQLEASRCAILKMKHYKDLHDNLHTLRFQFLDKLKMAVKLVRKNVGDESAWEELLQDREDLEDMRCDLKKMAAPDLPTSSAATMIEVVIKHICEVSDAISRRDGEQLERGFIKLKSVLAQKLSWTNNYLATAAHELRLANLIEALTYIHKSLDQTHTGQLAVTKFKSGVEALSSLSSALAKLTDEHDYWQQIDDYLGQVAQQDLENFSNWWPDLKRMTDRLSHSTSEEWGEKLRHDTEKVEQALTESDEMKVWSYFERYRKHIDRRFYDVDKRVKELCHDLGTISQPLTTLLELI